jgi:hypothetical protein
LALAVAFSEGRASARSIGTFSSVARWFERAACSVRVGAISHRQRFAQRVDDVVGEVLRRSRDRRQAHAKREQQAERLCLISEAPALRCGEFGQDRDAELGQSEQRDRACSLAPDREAGHAVLDQARDDPALVGEAGG